MSKLFHRGLEYFRKSWNNEYEFEQFIFSRITEIFPHLDCYKFKVDIYSDEHDRIMRADLLLVDKNYSTYSVVEVELITDTISHVKKQAEVFSSANYNMKMVESLCQNNPQIDSVRLLDLFTYQRPEVLILLNDNRISEKWKEVCVDDNVFLGFLEVYSADSRESIYHYSGYIPSEVTGVIVSGKKSKLMNNLIIEYPNLVDSDSEQHVQIIDNGTLVTIFKQGEILFPENVCSVYTKQPGSRFILKRGLDEQHFQLEWIAADDSNG